MAARGRFIPQNPLKYAGKAVKNIFFRSSWELAFMKWLDTTPTVICWGSEEFSIPYIHPIDNRVHQYYPDFIVMYKDRNNQIKKEIIEIKPYKESVATPKMTDRDAKALMINEAKWKFAAEWAEQNGAVFRILTEKSLFLSGPSVTKSKKAKGTNINTPIQ